MNIIKANLCYRFYTSDGWTRKKVSELLSHPDAFYHVLPRYYDNEKDITWERGWKLTNELEYSDCDYYAIHNSTVEMTLKLDEMNKNHQIK